METTKQRQVSSGKKTKGTEAETREYGKLLFGIMVLVCAAVVGITAFGNPQWETNDDVAIAQLLSRVDGDYSPFQWRVLSMVLHVLYMDIPDVEWWAVMTVVSIFISAVMTLHVIYRRFSGKTRVTIGAVLLVLLWFIALYRMNFTRTAIVIAVAACLLIADSVFVAKMTKALWAQYALGCVWLLLGASVRDASTMIALAFLAVIGLVRFLSDGFALRADWFKSHLRQIVLLGLSAALFFAASLADTMMLTAEQKEFLEYNTLRSSIQDFGGNYPAYQEAEETYQAMGLDENAQSMLFNWYSEDSEVFSEEIMEQVQTLAEPKVSFRPLREALAYTWFELLAAAVLIILLALLRKDCRRQAALILGVMVVLSVYLIVTGRYPARVCASILWAGLIAMTFLAGGEPEQTKDAFLPEDTEQIWAPMRQQKTRSRILAVWFAVTVGWGGWLFVQDIGVDVMAEHYQTQYEHQTIFDAMDQDREHIYLFDIWNVPAGLDRAFGFWEARPAEHCRNVFMLGGWNAHHPAFLDLMASYGITNPTRALFERTDVYSTYTDRLLIHLRNYYDEHMTASVTKEINEKRLVQYTPYVNDSQLPVDESTTVCVNEISALSGSQRGLTAVYADVTESVPSDTEEERIFYCNLTHQGERYTYRMKYDLGLLSAKFYGLAGDFDYTKADFQVFERTADGRYIAYPTT